MKIKNLYGEEIDLQELMDGYIKELEPIGDKPDTTVVNKSTITHTVQMPLSAYKEMLFQLIGLGTSILMLESKMKKDHDNK